jgi:hypothetical protein
MHAYGINRHESSSPEGVPVEGDAFVVPYSGEDVDIETNE